jgi:H+/gluconate symporter-like permease
MSFLVAVGALAFLMFVAYRGYSVILFAPVAAMGAVLLTDPSAVPPIFTGLFMEKMVIFVKLYFPVFLLGAVFGKVIELSGFSKSIVSAVIDLVGRERAMLSIVVVCCVLTYGGVSLFVVVFAVYPFAAEMFRQGDIPKRLIPGTIALGAFTATMDSFPGTPQIQNIIPTTFFKTDTWAAPWLGTFGGLFIIVVGLFYLEWRRRAAARAGEGYGTGHHNEPPPVEEKYLSHWAVALSPLVMVGVMNKVLTVLIPKFYGASSSVTLVPGAAAVVQPVSSVMAIWAVEGALLIGILMVVAFGWRQVAYSFAEGSRAAVAGSLLASLNTASEYGFGAVIAALPGFLVIQGALHAIPNPLVNIAVSVSTLAGVTGSASGGMDTLPHNGAVITLLNVTGLTHRQSYKDIFVVTCIKTSAVFVVILLYYFTGIV